MALPIVLALWALRVQQERRSDMAGKLAPGFALLALAAGGLVKFVAFFVGPPALVAALRTAENWRARLWLLAGGGAACLGLAALAYAPFFAGWATFANVAARESMYTSSWLAALHPVLVNTLGSTQADILTSRLSLLLLFAGVAWCTWRAWQHPHQIEQALLGPLLWFLLVCNPWFQPWYIIWLVALVAAAPWLQQVRAAVLAFCLTAMLNYVLNGLLLPALGLDQPPVLRELLVSLFVYGPPLALLFWPRTSISRVAGRNPASVRASAG